MRQIRVSDNGASRLITFFAGWGMDHVPFAYLRKTGYDIAVIYDYTTDSFDSSLFDGYEEIIVVAWSMGVWYADRIMRRYPDYPYTERIAVNGTLWPLDSERGIPHQLFVRSAEDVTTGFSKFYRRVCGGAAGQKQFMPALPSRGADEMKTELLAIADMVTSVDEIDGTELWDEIFISGRDLIFPPAAMNRAWEDCRGKITHLPDASHIIDFQWLIDTRVVDKELVGTRFAGAAETYNDNAGAQRRVARRLVELAAARLGDGKHRNLSILEIGAGAGMLTGMYLPMLDNCHIECWDISGVAEIDGQSNTMVRCQCDAETAVTAVASESYDVVFSSSTIQWFNSPATFIKRLSRILRPGGYAFISGFGPGTFGSLEGGGSFDGLNYRSFDREFLESAGFEAEIENEEIVERFDSPLEALRHLRSTGVNSLRRSPMGVADTRALLDRLTEPDGTASLTFNAQYYILYKPVEKETIFITGIDTDAGKSYATGWLANHISATGRKVMTQKFIQTGNVGRSEDIELHRKIMGLPIENEPWADTAPMIFSYPASPHLAANIDGRKVDLSVIDAARKRLEAQCDALLVEGAGGMMVPIDEDTLTVDYIVSRKLPVALVTNGRLGSISHTLLALEALKNRSLELRYLLYNTHFDKNDSVIADETREYIRRRVARDFPSAEFLLVPSINV